MTADEDDNPSPFTDAYELTMTHAAALFFAIGVQGAAFHGQWRIALAFCGCCALFALTQRFRFLARNTSWFLDSMVRNALIQLIVLGLGWVLHRLWVPLLGCGWAVLTLLMDAPKLSLLEERWRISGRRS
jgi:predicted permease